MAKHITCWQTWALAPSRARIPLVLVLLLRVNWRAKVVFTRKILKQKDKHLQLYPRNLHHVTKLYQFYSKHIVLGALRLGYSTFSWLTSVKPQTSPRTSKNPGVAEQRIRCEVVMDFERATWRAFQQVFPNAILRRCTFH